MDNKENKQHKIINFVNVGAISSLSSFIAAVVVAVFFTYPIYMNQLGGDINVTHKNRVLNTGDTLTLIVCVEDSTIHLKDVPVTPVINNPQKYSLKDFLLLYEAECANVMLAPTLFYDDQEYGNGRHVYKYKSSFLEAYNDTPSPVSDIRVEDLEGCCHIKTKASYNGISSVFDYYTDVWFFVEPNITTWSNNQLKTNIERRIKGITNCNYVDLYLVYKDYQSSYLCDIPLGSNEPKHVDNDKRVDKRVLPDGTAYKEMASFLIYFLFMMLLSCSACLGLLTLLGNIVLFVIGRFSDKESSSIDIVKDCCLYCFTRKDFERFESKGNAIEALIFTWIAILSPITCYICFRIFF